ncbi:PilW family protein [Saccharospirillum sp. HFRX-1]|uniref:PilW family protein n=1 Tax=unclassified Saccharospirillum TaxID=2633430 RepID=UPI00371AA319
MQSSPKTIGVSGFSLIELLVAMALSLLIISTVTLALINSQRSHALLQQQGRLQETARLAMDIILADIKQVGFVGCPSGLLNIANLVRPGSEDYFSLLPLISAEDDVDDPDHDVVVGTDVITLTLLETDAAFSVENQTSNGSETQLTLASGSRFDSGYDGEIMVLVDSNCTNMAIFRATRISNTSLAVTTLPPEPGEHNNYNCTHRLRGNFTCSDTSGADVQPAYAAGSMLYPLQQRSYAIRNKDNAGNELGQINTTANDEMLLKGVDDLQLLYGLDTDNPRDGIVDRFVDAQQIKASSVLNFSQLVVVELSVTVSSESSLESDEALSTTLSSSVYLHNGGW